LGWSIREDEIVGEFEALSRMISVPLAEAVRSVNQQSVF
jgi:hypothetical protein